MNFFVKTFAICSLAPLILLSGCEHKTADTGKNIVIEPGAFVATQPSALRGNLSNAKKCSLDTVNGKPREPKVGWSIKQGQPIDVQGWAFSEDGKSAAPQLFIQLNGQADSYYAVTNTRSLRSDANQRLATSATVEAGFSLQATTAAIPSGTYEIVVVQVFSDRVEACEDGVSLTIN
jgi:hypothetical protein